MIKNIHEYFSHSAEKSPAKIAVSCGEKSATFNELELKSNALARHLKAAGAERGQLIPFFMSKSIDSILSILGTLKADCAYVPIDVKSPSGRLIAILESTKCSLLLVNSESVDTAREFLGNHSNIKIIDISQLTLTGEHCKPIVSQNLSIDLAYVLFTSGSTGIPKGVMIPHKAIIDYIDWCVETYGLNSEDVISNHAPLYFDNSTFDLYTAFKTGATLHLVPDSLNAVLPRLVKWLTTNDITTFFCVPSVLTMLLKSRRLKPDSFPKLRHIICAGEVLPTSILKEWMALYPHIQFTNMYGPTEITVDCSYRIINDISECDRPSIPIGKARKNMELFVKSSDGMISQQPGAEGELLVRGTSVAYGYLGDDKKTREVFIQNPKHEQFHDPLYCTGDRVKIDQHGEFLFAGRIDDQIKYLGYRIELGEIEAALNLLNYVFEAVVIFHKSENDDDSYIGALIQKDSTVDLGNIRDDLHKKIPNYMIPAKIIEHLGELPRTPNGKYNRKEALKIIQNH